MKLQRAVSPERMHVRFTKGRITTQLQTPHNTAHNVNSQNTKKSNISYSNTKLYCTVKEYNTEYIEHYQCVY